MILFNETQRFKQWWIWLIVLVANGTNLFFIYNQFVNNKISTSNNNLGLIIAGVSSILLTLLFFIIKLDTVIKDDGIYVRFFPVHIKFKYMPWQNINKCYVRQYSPLKEYGGWGIRVGLFDKGKAYNISGNIGLQIEFKDNKKLLIGTNKPDELGSIVTQLNKTDINQ
jgi:hypothetical protein